MATPNAYIRNLHNWQSNDNFIAGRFGSSSSGVLPVRNQGPFQSDKLSVEGFQEHLNTPPYTISGNHIDSLLKWLNDLCDKHNLTFYESIVDPNFINVEISNNNFKWRFKWLVKNGIGGDKTLYVDLSSPNDPPPENYNDTIRGYTWDEREIWKQIRKAIKHLCLSVNIVPPHEVAELSETDHEEEASSGSEKWWDKDNDIRDSRWFSEENRVEYGLLMPPDDSSPLDTQGIPPEIHLMDGTNSVYGTIGQYGVTNTEEYMQYFKKPYSYLKGDFFNFRISKSGQIDISLRQIIPPNECGVCNTVYKYVTWYRKIDPLEDVAAGYFSYLPTKESKYLVNGFHDLQQGAMLPYASYDLNQPACVLWQPLFNTPILCSNQEGDFLFPEKWVCSPISKWYAFETDKIGPVCSFNGGNMVYQFGADCKGCPPVNLQAGCTTPFINLPPNCGTCPDGSSWRAYFSPPTAKRFYTDTVVDPTTTSQLLDIHDAVNFDIGYYFVEGAGTTDNYDGLGSLGLRKCSKNNDITATLECKPLNTVDKALSYFDVHAYAGGGPYTSAFVYDWNSHDGYEAILSDANLALAERIRVKQFVFHSLYGTGSFPSNTLLAPETIHIGVDNCQAQWIGAGSLAIEFTRQCYYPPCDWRDSTCGGFQFPSFFLISDAIANSIINEAYNATAPRFLHQIHIPYFDGMIEYESLELDDIPFWYADGNMPYTPILRKEDKFHYGERTSGPDIISVTPKDYYHTNNAFKAQTLFNQANPNNTGMVDYGGITGGNYAGWAPNYYPNDLDVIAQSGNWVLGHQYDYFSTASDRSDFAINGNEESLNNWYEVDYSEEDFLVPFDMHNCNDIIQDRIQAVYDNQDFQYHEYEDDPDAVYPVASYATVSSHVSGFPSAWNDTARFSFAQGMNSPMEACQSNIDININIRQDIHVSATYLHMKSMINKFGFGQAPVQGEDETDEDFDKRKMLYRGKIFFGHGVAPHYEGIGAFPLKIFRSAYLRLLNHPVSWLNDGFDDPHSFAKYTLEHWSGKLKIVYGYASLSSYETNFEDDSLTWTHELPSHTNQTELYELVSRRVGDVLCNPNTSKYGKIVGEFTYSEHKPTRIDPSNGHITVGDIVDFEIDMEEIVEWTSEEQNMVLFVAHYIDTNKFNMDEENPTTGAKFIMPKPKFHWNGGLIDEETLPFCEDQQVYGGYADIYENVDFTETTTTSRQYFLDHDLLWNSNSTFTEPVEVTEVSKTVAFTPFYYPSGQNWFGTPSGYYWDYVVKSLPLTLGDATGPTIPYQGRFGDVPSFRGFAYDNQSGTPEQTKDDHPMIAKRAQAHIAFKIPWPLFKVGDKSAGGNTDGNDDINANLTKWTNDQLTPADICENQ